MARDEQKVEIEHVDSIGSRKYKDEIHRHPAFGMARISRPQGNAVLFGSTIKHQHFVTLTISTAKLRRDTNLHMDWYSDEDELIEVAMSESQWSQIVSSPTSTGVPVTLTRIQHQSVPRIPFSPEGVRIANEVGEFFERINHELSNLTETVAKQLEDDSVPKAKAQRVLSHVNSAERRVSDHLPFLVGQVRDLLERMVSQSKTEIDQYARSQGVNSDTGSLLSLSDDSSSSQVKSKRVRVRSRGKSE